MKSRASSLLIIFFVVIAKYTVADKMLKLVTRRLFTNYPIWHSSSMETVISCACELTTSTLMIRGTRDIYKMRRKGRKKKKKKKEERYSSKSFPTLVPRCRKCKRPDTIVDKESRAICRKRCRPRFFLFFFSLSLPSTSEPPLARLGIGIFARIRVR